MRPTEQLVRPACVPHPHRHLTAERAPQRSAGLWDEVDWDGPSPRSFFSLQVLVTWEMCNSPAGTQPPEKVIETRPVYRSETLQLGADSNPIAHRGHGRCGGVRIRATRVRQEGVEGSIEGGGG